MGRKNFRAHVGTLIAKNRQRFTNTRRAACLCAAEMLESRMLLSAVSWDGGGDATNWNDALNWSTNTVPGSADDVTIDVPGSITVLYRGSQPTVQSLINRETLWVRGDNNFGSASANISGNVTNDGTIRLESQDSSWSSSLTSSAGTITNSASGVIQSNIGSGGARSLSGNLDNSGSITTATDLVVSASGKTFNQLAGSVTATGTGHFVWSQGTMNFSGGSFTGAVSLRSGSLNVASTAGAQTIVVEGTSTLLASDSTSATVWIQGNNQAGGATLNTGAGTVTNNGAIRIESIDSSWSSQLVIGGVLNNSSTGSITSNVGSGGTRAISGNLDNSGAITTATDLTVNGTGKTFNQLAGSVNATGASGKFTWASGTMNFSGGTLTGPVYVGSGSLSVAASAGAQTILVAGNSTLLNNLSTSATVWVQGNGAFGTATLAIGNVTNNGTIRMESIDSSYSESLNITGTLTNSSTGTIQINLGTGGSRSISGNLDNSGTINTAADVTVSGSGKTFNQLAGSVNATGASGRFTWSGGTVNFSGGAFNGPVYVSSASLSVAATAGSQTILVVGNSTLLNSLSTSATVWVQGNGAFGTATLAIGTVTNNGTIRMESIDSSYTETLNISGTLTNSGTGVIQVNLGTGGPRNINGNLDNSGSITSNVALALSGTTFNNSGTITANGVSVTVSGTTFNQTGGSINASGASARFTWQTGTMNFSGGTLTGPVGVANGLLNVTASAGAQTILIQGNSTLLDSASTTATVWLQGNSSFGPATLAIGSITNNGTIRIESIDSSYSESLNISGVLTNSGSGAIVANVGTGGSRTITGNINNSGAINTSADLSFAGTGKTLNQMGGSINATGASGRFTWSNGAANFSGGSLAGPVYFASCTVSVAATMGAQTILMVGTGSTFLGNLSTAATVWLQGNGNFGAASASAAGSVTNNGILRLESIDSSYSETLTIGGTLTNSGTATLAANLGSGGQRSITTGALQNDGAITQSTGGTLNTGTIDGSGSITLTGSPTLNASRIRQTAFASDGPVNIAANGTDAMTSVIQNFTLTGTMDLNDNALIVDYSGASPIGTIRTMLATGYNNGSWNGAGIKSTSATANVGHKTALGFAEATDLYNSFPQAFAGQNVDSTSVLIRYTLYGDANLDRSVDTVDFNLLAANFSGSGKRWSQGDFNFDQSVDTVDFNLLAARFSQSLPAPPLPAAASPAYSIFGNQRIGTDSADSTPSVLA